MVNSLPLATISYNPLARLCTPSSTPRLFKLTPIAPLIYELFLTILTIVKAFDFVGHPSGPSLPLLVKYLRESQPRYLS